MVAKLFLEAFLEAIDKRENHLRTSAHNVPIVYLDVAIVLFSMRSSKLLPVICFAFELFLPGLGLSLWTVLQYRVKKQLRRVPYDY